MNTNGPHLLEIRKICNREIIVIHVACTNVDEGREIHVVAVIMLILHFSFVRNALIIFSVAQRLECFVRLGSIKFL